MSHASLLFAVLSILGEPRALTPLDALAWLPGTTGRIEHFGDWNRDGVPDVVMEHAREGWVQIQVHCAMDGIGLIVLWVGPQSLAFDENPPWELGDLDGDGVLDLILGFPGDSTAGTNAGAVQIVSGATAQTIAVNHGSKPDERYGSAVAFLGDLDGDGVGDYAVGSPSPSALNRSQLRLGVGLLPPVGSYGKDSPQQVLDARGDATGRVSAVSGADGRVLWVSGGRRPGHGFGESLASMGDLDGDCRFDLLVRCSSDSIEPISVLSGRTGSLAFRLAHQYAPCGDAGDFDGDGLDDVFLDSFTEGSSDRGEKVSVVSTRTREVIARAAYPSWFGGFGRTVGVGDIDGDGFDDLALGEPDFNLPTSRGGGRPVELDALKAMSLSEALAIESRPTSMTSESGALRVVSGRTRKPIVGVWGRPGTWDSIGYSACSIPDVSGDGHPELVVAGGRASYVFEGPGALQR